MKFHFSLWYHGLAWALYVLIYSTLWADPQKSFFASLLIELALLPFKLILTYIVIGWLVPAFLFPGRSFAFAGLLVAIIICIGLLHQVYTYYVVHPLFSISNGSEGLWDWSRISKRATYLNTPMLIATTLVVLRRFYMQNEMYMAIANEKLQGELRFLKGQFQPHFFFNTMNNLYSLALKKSDQAPTLILKLTDLMRYSLEQSEKDHVSLQDELTFIRNYVAIEEERFAGKVQVEWDVHLKDPSQSVPPLLLMPFIENAFKHGVSQAREEVRITIRLQEISGRLVYVVTNAMPHLVAEVKGQQTNKIGLENLKKRLELTYKKNYKLTLNSNGVYTAGLEIPLKA